MTTAYTTLLGLALPVQGELQGTWGDEVNNYITNYLDAAVAGTQTISGSQTAVTLSKTTGSSLSQAGSGATGSSQYFVINCTGNPAGTLTITAPAASKAYLIINATSTSQDVKIVGAGPTTGVTLVSGERAIVSWNGSDFVKVANFGGVGSFTTISATTGNITTVNATTVDTTNLEVTNIKAKDGTASASIADSTGAFTVSAAFAANGNTTLGDAVGDLVTVNGTTTFVNANPTLSAGTANGVLYLNGSKVATSGTALAFNGTTLSVTGNVSSSNAGNENYFLSDGSTRSSLQQSSNALYYNINDNSATSGSFIWRNTNAFSELMRLTSTGLGIGTSSPVAKLDVRSAIGTSVDASQNINAIDTTAYALGNGGGVSFGYVFNSGGSVIARAAVIKGIKENATDGNYATALTFSTTANSASTTEKMRLDASGNLGLGVTPSAWNSTWRASEIQRAGNAVTSNAVNSIGLSSNAYFDSVGWKYGANGAANFMAVGNGGGQFAWFTAPSGTAGNTISFTQAMTLDASGNLLVGTTSSIDSNFKLQLNAPASGVRGIGINNDGGYGVYLTFDKTGRYSTDAAAIRSIPNVPLVFETNNTERARITSGGDLLVGTTNGSNKLEVASAGSVTAAIRSTSAGTSASPYSLKLSFVGVDGGGVNAQEKAYVSAIDQTFNDQSSYLAFGTNNAGTVAERARITSGGDLLVGKTAQNVAAVGTEITSTGTNRSSVADSTNASSTYEVYSTTALAYRFYVGLAGTIYATSTTITAISDQRLKENIRDLDAGLTEVMALKPRKFDWKSGKGKNKKNDRGWIAQEFEQVFPDMVDTWADPAPEGEEPYKAVNADLIPVLVKAIQEQQAIITALTARVAALEGKV